MYGIGKRQKTGHETSQIGNQDVISHDAPVDTCDIGDRRVMDIHHPG
jgi:hypothetical protein